MEINHDEQTQLTAQTAEAEEILGENDSKVSLGKFKDVNALLSAYGSLQSEFTKRCQRVKELESALASVDKEKSPTEEQPKTEQPPKADITDEERKNVLVDYLKGVLGRKQKAVLLDGAGVGVKTPVSRPKTIEQAGALAKEILDK